MPVTPNAIDLTQLASVKLWASVTGAGLDQEIQDCITSFSMWALTFTGRGQQDGSPPSASPLNSIVTFSETYDGNDSRKLFLRNSPIKSVTSLTINGVTITLSSQYGMAGYVISGDGKSIQIRGGGGGNGPSFNTTNFGALGGCSQFFARGIQNVSVVYTAGYSTVPFDLEMCARKVVALNYKRATSIGQKSQAMAQGAGTISYNDWEMDKDCMRTIMSYRRTAVV